MISCLYVLCSSTGDDEDVFCVNDGNAPGYMMAFAQAWIQNTLEMCCRENFQFMFSQCMGNAESISLNPCPGDGPPAVHTAKWYVKYDYSGGGDPQCVQDCAMGPDCDGWSEHFEELYDSYEDCCKTHLWWVTGRCDRTSPSAMSNSTEVATDNAGWYVVYHTNQDPQCVQDCDGEEPCGGLATFTDDLHSSFTECCAQHLWWIADSPCSLI